MLAANVWRNLSRVASAAARLWRSFEAVSHDDVAAKLDADTVLRASTDGGDVRASEWESEEGRRLLMIEVSC